MSANEAMLREAAARHRRVLQVPTTVIAELLDELDQQRIRAEAAEAELAAAVAWAEYAEEQVRQYRSTVTTGGPRPPVTQQWHNGASSRPSTAPGEGS